MMQQMMASKDINFSHVPKRALINLHQGDFSGKIPIIYFFPNVIPSIARNPIIQGPQYYNIRQLDDACLIMRVQVF